MARKNIAAGNWKMNKAYQEGLDLATAVVDGTETTDTIVIMSTPFIHLQSVVEIAKSKDNVKVAAQNCHQAQSGAYTGEISVGMLNSIGVDCVVLGHSERREYFNENNTLLAEKVKTVLGAGMQPIFCCGEALPTREAGEQVEYVSNQIKESLFDLSAEDFSKIVIAYEPIWAIGTGVTASPQQAQDMHAAIRNLISDKYGSEVAENTSILYGGSVKPTNAKEIFSQKDVDGGLVGGASLKADDFLAIVHSF